MSVFKRGNVYWYEFWLNGRRVRATTRLTNKTAARKAETLKRAELVLRKEVMGQSAAPMFDVFTKEEFLPWSRLQHRAHPKTHERTR